MTREPPGPAGKNRRGAIGRVASTQGLCARKKLVSDTRMPEQAPANAAPNDRLDPATLLALYEHMLLARLIEEKAIRLLRQGKISKWFSGIGQEGVAVGATLALRQSDPILPLHRNLGVFTTRGVPLDRLFSQWQGKADGYTKGRDRSFHFGALDHGVVGMISHLGAMLGVADGMALASKLDRAGRVALVFSGDGGTSEGDFHESVNLAAVWELPVIFLVENNGYGLSTPSSQQFRCERIIDKAPGYGIEGIRIDGNDALQVYRTISDVASSLRARPRAVLIEAMTFRMRGHEEASGTKYVPQELFDQWAKKDPLVGLRARLEKLELIDDVLGGELRRRCEERIDEAWDRADAAPAIESTPERELADVFLSWDDEEAVDEAPTSSREIRFVDAISEGLACALEEDEGTVLMGQDVGAYGGVFKISQGFVERFGAERVRDTPLCESAVLGAGLGLALAGHRAVVEMQFADFVSCGFNQIVNNLAKTHYRWGEAVNVTVRMPTGGGTGAGPFHSQSNEAWFTHVPGLKVVYPSSPADAKGLLLASIRDPNPVLFFEHKLLYRSVQGPVAEEPYVLALGKAGVVRRGDAMTLVTYGSGVGKAQEFAEQRVEDIEIIDLRTLIPWDRETVYHSVRRTGRCLILHEDTLCGGIGAEIAADLGKNAFDWLDAPIFRVASLDTPVPFSRSLEASFLPWGRLESAVEELLSY